MENIERTPDSPRFSFAYGMDGERIEVEILKRNLGAEPEAFFDPSIDGLPEPELERITAKANQIAREWFYFLRNSPSFHVKRKEKRGELLLEIQGRNTFELISRAYQIRITLENGGDHDNKE